MERPLAFGSYRFDTDSGRLWSGRDEIRLTPKASAVLAMLLARAGEPVSKEDLFASVWNGTTVSDDALTSCIQELRKALSDDSKNPRFIETRHRRGYCFIAPLSAGSPDADTSTIAVLPFADMSPGRNHDYLCEGLAEELINALTHIDGLRVASRTASFQFRGGGDIHAIARHLGVGTLLEGSVRVANDRLRITVQLIEVATGYHLWSQRFDRKLDDVFAIQDEIAQHVATSLRGGVLSRKEERALVRPQTEVAGYEFYLRGRQLIPRMTKLDFERSAEMFERAIKVDPAYAPAWAGLATVHATLYEWFGAQEKDLDRAEETSLRACELGPDLAVSHVARGFVLSLQRRYDDAAREFEEARRINPNLFEAYYYDARAAFARGEVQRSAELFAKAADLRPDDFQSPLLQSQSLDILGRSDEAKIVRREGIRRAEQVLALNPLDSRALSLGSLHLLVDGQTERAIDWSQRGLSLNPDDLSTLINGACFRLRLGRNDEALDLLERVSELGYGKRDWIEHDPDYDNIRDDPRFTRVLARLK